MHRKIILSVGIFIFLISLAAADQQGASKVRIFPAPPKLTSSVQFVEPSGNNILDAGETGKLIVTIQNTGNGDAFDVKAGIKPNKRINGLSFNTDVSIGSIPAGQSIKQEITLSTNEDIPTDTVSFDITLTEANGFDPAPVKITFKTKAFEPPKLIVADIGINDQNKNARVEPMEIVEVTARIQNTGYGEARNVSVDVQPGQMFSWPATAKPGSTLETSSQEPIKMLPSCSIPIPVYKTMRRFLSPSR